MSGPPRQNIASRAGRAFLLLLYLLPLGWLVATSFKPEAEILENPSSLLFRPTLDGYRAIIADAIPALLNSAQIAVAATAFSVVLAVPAAYGLARRRSRSWTIVTTVVLGSLIVLQMVPQPMSVIPLYSVLARWNLTDTILGVAVADTSLHLPFAILLLRPFFLAVPAELEEAALVDGATLRTLFFRVIIPVARNGIITVGVVVFMLSWGEFIYSTTFLTQPSGYPVSALLAQQISLYGTSWGRLMALGVLTTLPILIVFLFSQRKLTQGMLSGALK